MPILEAGSAYFALVFGAGFLLGAIRVALVVPRLGVRAAELLEMPIMLAAIVLSARYIVRRFALPPRAAVGLPVGLVALALLIVAELSLVLLLQRQSVGQYIAGRDPVSGTVYLATLVLYALMPAIVAHRRGTIREE
jgi:hypothetical protein